VHANDAMRRFSLRSEIQNQHPQQAAYNTQVQFFIIYPRGVGINAWSSLYGGGWVQEISIIAT
jgi:hypothetical protein